MTKQVELPKQDIVYKDTMGHFYLRSEKNVSIRIDENAYKNVIKTLAQAQQEAVERERERIIHKIEDLYVGTTEYNVHSEHTKGWNMAIEKCVKTLQKEQE